MDDAELVRGLERFGDLPRDWHGLAGRHRAAGNAIGECLAFDELQASARTGEPSPPGASSSP
jgi:hypothetical protein